MRLLPGFRRKYTIQSSWTTSLYQRRSKASSVEAEPNFAAHAEGQHPCCCSQRKEQTQLQGAKLLNTAINLPCSHPSTGAADFFIYFLIHTRLRGSLVNRHTPFAFLFSVQDLNGKLVHGVWCQVLHQRPPVGHLLVIPPCRFPLFPITNAVLPGVRNTQAQKFTHQKL